MTEFNFNFGNLPRLDLAACKDFPSPDLFFPEARKVPVEQVERIKQICGTCLEKQACLDYALDNFEEHGYWGGLSPAERTQQFPGPEKISRGKGHKVLKDMELLSISLQDALQLHGIQMRSFIRWQQREDHTQQLLQIKKGNDDV